MVLSFSRARFETHWRHETPTTVFFLVVVAPRQAMANIRVYFCHENALYKKYLPFGVGLKLGPTTCGTITSGVHLFFFDSKGIVHNEFVPAGKTVNAIFYLGVLKRLLHRIRRIRSEYRKKGSWRLLHDNAHRSHRSTLVTAFLTRNRILSINHSPYSTDLAPCGFYLCGKLHLTMKGKTFCVRRCHPKGLYQHPEGHSRQ